MLPDQNLPAVNTNQDIEQICNNLPSKELNDFLLEQLFYARLNLYYLDGSLFARKGNHLEAIPDSKLESLVLSVLDDKFRLIGKRSRVKSIADLIRLRNPKDFINILPDNKIIAFKNGVFDANTFWFYETTQSLGFSFEQLRINCRYELNMEFNSEWFSQSYRSKNENCKMPMYSSPAGLIYLPEFPFADFCKMYNSIAAWGTPGKLIKGSTAFDYYYHEVVPFFDSICKSLSELHTPVADKFFSDIANGNPHIIERIYQMIGYILVPGKEAKVYFLLQGESNSGKSILGNFSKVTFLPSLLPLLISHALAVSIFPTPYRQAA